MTKRIALTACLALAAAHGVPAQAQFVASEIRTADEQRLRLLVEQASTAARADQLDEAARLYGEAKTLGERLMADDPANATLLRDVSAAYLLAANLSVLKQDYPAARSDFSQALLLGIQLADLDPTDVSFQRFLASAYNGLGSVDQAEGKLAEARTRYERALTIRQKLALDNPRAVEAQRDLASSYVILGNLLVELGEAPAAIEMFEAELVMAEAMAATAPDNLSVQLALADRLKRLGETSIMPGDYDRARDYFERRQQLLEPLLSAGVATGVLEREIWLNANQLGQIAQATGNVADGMRWAQQSLEIARRRVEAQPGDPERERDFAISLWNLASVPGSDLPWTRVRDQLAAMQARGLLDTNDLGLLEEATSRAEATSG